MPTPSINPHNAPKQKAEITHTEIGCGENTMNPKDKGTVVLLTREKAMLMTNINSRKNQRINLNNFPIGL